MCFPGGDENKTFFDITRALFTGGNKDGDLSTENLFSVKLYSRNTVTDAANTSIPAKLAVADPATPPVGDGLGCCVEAADVMEGVDPGVEDDCVATALDGRLVAALLTVPVDVTTAASATKELTIDE